MAKCPVCSSKMDQGLKKQECKNCYSKFRKNYEVLAFLILFFSLPSIFIVKGTGNFWFLMSALIGVVIYVFNFKYIRDETYLIGLYQQKSSNLDIVQRAISEQVGPIDLLVNLPELANSFNLSSEKREELLKDIITYGRSPSIDLESQKKAVEQFIDYQTFKETCMNHCDELRQEIAIIKKYHSNVKGIS